MISLFLASLLAAQPGAPAGTPWVLLCAGQSNMMGRPACSEMPVGTLRFPDRVWNFANDFQLKPAVCPIEDATGQWHSAGDDSAFPKGLSPCQVAADRIAEAINGMVIVVPCAAWGSGIDAWKVPILPPVSAAERSAFAQAALTLYGACRDRALMASHYGEIKGILYQQGESNTALSPLTSTVAFAQKTQALWTRWRYDFAEPFLPVIFGQLKVSGYPAGNGYVRWPQIRNAQATLQSPTQLMVTNSTSGAQPGEPQHLGIVPVIDQGERMADALLNYYGF